MFILNKKSAMETKFLKVSLVLCSYESFFKVFEPVKLNPDDLKTLELEVEDYNAHLELMFKGKALDSSYSDLEDKFIMNEIDEGRGYKNGVGIYGRQYYGDGSRPAFFLILCYDHDEDIECILWHLDDLGNIDTMEKDEAVQVFTPPFGDDEFSIGYKILPLTQKLLDSR